MPSSHIEKMFSLAQQVLGNAYAPYSKFQVGCCIRTKDDLYFTGANVENSVYPSSQCAEASAVGNMIANGQKEIVEILVMGNSHKLCSPCGNCRQILAEFSEPQTIVHICDKNTVKQSLTFEELLPIPFK